MKQRRRFGRRRSDRWTLILAVLAVLALYLTYLNACHGKSPTGPDIVKPAPAATPAAQEVTADVPEESPESAVPQGEGADMAAHFWVFADGHTKVFNGFDSMYKAKVCVFLDGPHPQVSLVPGGFTFDIPAGQTRSENLPPTPELQGESELCGEHRLQVDAGPAGGVNCYSPSNALGDLKAWNFPTVDFGECECVPSEEPTIVSKGDPYRGDKIDCPVAPQRADAEEVCYDCYELKQDITWTDGCKEWTETITLEEIDREVVECECTEEGPYEGDPDWSGEILEGPCPEPSASAVALECHENGTIPITWDCQDPTSEPTCRAAECPCQEEWIVDDEPTFISEDEPGECTPVIDSDDRHCAERHLKHYAYYETNTCTQERRIKEGSEFTEPVANECECDGYCYYRVSCGEQGDLALDRECTDQAQQSICEAAHGIAGDWGLWRNFGDANLLNHCQFFVPGYQDRDFQLNPGQSAEGCLGKND